MLEEIKTKYVRLRETDTLTSLKLKAITFKVNRLTGRQITLCGSCKNEVIKQLDDLFNYKK